MPEYIDPPLVTEPDDLSQEAFAFLEDNIPGWLPAPGNLEVWLVESLAQLAAELMDVASAVPTSIFKYYGASVLGLVQHPSQSATGLTTWTALDNKGYTIEAGTLIGISAAGDELIPFEVQTEAVIAVGATSVTDVIVVAVDPGKDANGLSAAPEVIDPLDWVQDVVMVGTTGGGIDEETDDEYLDRLRELATLLAPRPILPNDFAVLARTVGGVGRSMAVDLYNADTEESDVPRCVTVVVAAEDGTFVGPGVKEEVDALLQAEREVNFLVFVVDPEYTDIDVAFTFSTYPTYDPLDVKTRAETAVEEYLSPANFGNVPFGDRPEWLADTKVRYLEVAEVINRVEGLWYVGTLTINGGTTDVDLTGVGPLPNPGDIDGEPIP